MAGERRLIECYCTMHDIRESHPCHTQLLNDLSRAIAEKLIEYHKVGIAHEQDGITTLYARFEIIVPPTPEKPYAL